MWICVNCGEIDVPDKHQCRLLVVLKHQQRYAEGYKTGVEDAAKIVQDHDEVIVLSTGERKLMERTNPTNLVGLAYLKAIRQLLATEKKK